MPTYDYVCGGCEHTFEAFQSIKANALKKCPACGESKLKRLIGTGAGVIFKGSGFYETDYRSDSYKKAAKADTGEKADGGDKSASTKSEAGGKSEGGSSSASKEGTSSTTTPPAKNDSPGKSTGKQGGEAGKSGSSQ